MRDSGAGWTGIQGNSNALPDEGLGWEEASHRSAELSEIHDQCTGGAEILRYTIYNYLSFCLQVVSACKFGILRQYDPLDTIFPETKDNVNYVHFVLSGECVLLQCLNVKVRLSLFGK